MPDKTPLEAKGEDDFDYQALKGRRKIRFDFKETPLKIFHLLGRPPLPPYVKRPSDERDLERYQTIYAKSPGAVAAPTAGLHFTNEHLERLKAQGHQIVFLTLRVGVGTFAPLTPQMVENGLLHREWVEIGSEAAKAVTEAKKEGRIVVAVGTTTARALEWAAEGDQIIEKSGWCSLFIRPGHKFKIVEALLTNFHLPRSSLMMLVGALIGRKRLLESYQLAIKEAFRFYSYGDAMLIV
jgi:S-adenosylmethionine:tRNA ribosyltransferase-isomerase